MKKPEISIVIPFKDEVHRLPKTIGKITSYAKRYLGEYEIIMVDDGSTDGSAQNIERFFSDPHIRLLTHTVNQGKGAAVRTGVLSAKGSLILFSDADLATPMKETRALMQNMRSGDCDIVIASRALPASRILTPQPFSRIVIGKLGNLFIRLVTGLPFKDTQCGFKLFKTSVAKELFQEQYFPRWSFDIEVLYKAKKKGYHICERAVEWSDKTGSKVRPIHDSFAVLRDTMRIRRMYK